MYEIWKSIQEFPAYSVSSLGRIRNDERERILRQSYTKAGVAKVGLVISGVQHARSVKVLVAEAFVEGCSDQFDTPINLDGDSRNNEAVNLMWRPRWFAWKYTHQFGNIDKYRNRGPLKDRKTGDHYEDIFEAGTRNGLLCREIHFGIVKNVPIFPTWQIFEWVR